MPVLAGNSCRIVEKQSWKLSKILPPGGAYIRVHIFSPGRPLCWPTLSYKCDRMRTATPGALSCLEDLWDCSDFVKRIISFRKPATTTGRYACIQSCCVLRVNNSTRRERSNLTPDPRPPSFCPTDQSTRPGSWTVGGRTPSSEDEQGQSGRSVLYSRVPPQENEVAESAARRQRACTAYYKGQHIAGVTVLLELVGPRVSADNFFIFCFLQTSAV